LKNRREKLENMFFFGQFVKKKLQLVAPFLAAAALRCSACHSMPALQCCSAQRRV
jgi:hypothetical protein